MTPIGLISWCMECCTTGRARPHLQCRASQHAPLAANCRSDPTTIATSASAVMSSDSDPLLTYIRSKLQSKRSQGDSAMLASGGSGSRSVDLTSFGSQGSVQFDELEILRPCGEGSFGKVRCASRCIGDGQPAGRQPAESQMQQVCKALHCRCCSSCRCMKPPGIRRLWR